MAGAINVFKVKIDVGRSFAGIKQKPQIDQRFGQGFERMQLCALHDNI